MTLVSTQPWYSSIRNLENPCGNPDLLRFHYHKLNLIQKQLYELNMPLREYQTDMMQMPLVRQFITDDEVNADLTLEAAFPVVKPVFITTGRRIILPRKDGLPEA